MKIIDLYKLISNKEIDKLPQKIKWRNVTYDLDIDEEFINYNPQEHGDWLLNQYLWKLNDEVEIIEEDNNKIEKLKRITKCIGTDEDGTYYTDEYTIPELVVKIEEIIDKLNNME